MAITNKTITVPAATTLTRFRQVALWPRLLVQAVRITRPRQFPLTLTLQVVPRVLPAAVLGVGVLLNRIATLGDGFARLGRNTPSVKTKDWRRMG